jgi:hypothetical protein
VWLMATPEALIWIALVAAMVALALLLLLLA